MSKKDKDEEKNGTGVGAKTFDVLPACDPKLLAWLEELFAPSGDAEHSTKNAPEKVEVVQTTGPGGRVRGNTLDTFHVGPGDKEPTKERLVQLTNRFRMAAQQDCDTEGKAGKYAVLAVQTQQGDRAYKIHRFQLEPSSGIGLAARSVTAIDEDDSEAHRDGLGSDKLLRRIDRVFEDDRWRVEQQSQAVGGVIKTQNQLIEFAFSHVREVMTQFLSGMKIFADASMQIHKIRAEERYEEFKYKMLERGADKLGTYFPVIVNKLAGKEVIPASAASQENSAQAVIRKFFDSLTRDQALALIGVWDETGAEPVCQTAGVFRKDQLDILDGIVKGKLEPSAISGLMNGPTQITPDQFQKVTQICSQQQLDPLFAFAATQTGTKPS